MEIALIVVSSEHFLHELFVQLEKVNVQYPTRRTKTTIASWKSTNMRKTRCQLFDGMAYQTAVLRHLLRGREVVEESVGDGHLMEIRSGGYIVSQLMGELIALV